MIYYQVMYCGDWLKFLVLQEILLTDRALTISEKDPIMPLLWELSLRGKEKKSNKSLRTGPNDALWD